MLTLYKEIDNAIHYWTTFDKDDKTGIIYWGVVGKRGSIREIKSGFFLNFKGRIKRMIDKKIKSGFSEFAKESYVMLEIEFMIDGFGTEEDIDKRHRLEELLEEIMLWSGLGYCNGGSIGSGTMEAGCCVANYEIAKKIIEVRLVNTEYSNYSRIYKR